MPKHERHYQNHLRRIYPDRRPRRPDLSRIEKILISVGAGIFVVGVLGLAAYGGYRSLHPDTFATATPAAGDCPPTATKTGMTTFTDPFRPESEVIETTAGGSKFILTDEGYLVKVYPDGGTRLLGQIDQTGTLTAVIDEQLSDFPDCDWILRFGVTAAPQGAGTFTWGIIAEPNGN